MSDDSKIVKLQDSPQKMTNFKEFGMYIMANDLTAASRCLRDILQVPLATAEKSANHFHQLYQSNSEVLMKTMGIRQKIEEGANNDALMLIQEIFGLEGFESINAFEAMRKIVTENLQ